MPPKLEECDRYRILRVLARGEKTCRSSEQAILVSVDEAGEGVLVAGTGSTPVVGVGREGFHTPYCPQGSDRFQIERDLGSAGSGRMEG